MLDVEFAGRERCYLQAPEGVRVGDSIAIGENAEVKAGNVLPLKSIPEGTSVFNIEIRPGDGGKIVRTSGAFAKVATKMDKSILIVLPSSKKMEFNPECRASVGVIAGGGRT